MHNMAYYTAVAQVIDYLRYFAFVPYHVITMLTANIDLFQFSCKLEMHRVPTNKNLFLPMTDKHHAVRDIFFQHGG